MTNDERNTDLCYVCDYVSRKSPGYQKNVRIKLGKNWCLIPERYNWNCTKCHTCWWKIYVDTYCLLDIPTIKLGE